MPTTEHPVKLLDRLLVALEIDQPLPRDVRDWLRHGLHEFKNSENSKLNDCLGFATQQGRQYETVWRLSRFAQRDKSLKTLAANLTGSNRQRAKTIADAIALFKRHGGPNYEAKKALLKNQVEYDLLLAAFRSGAVLPDSARQIQRILDNETLSARRNV